MNNLFQKIRFLLTKPKLIIITGSGKETANRAVVQILRDSFRIGRDVLVFTDDINAKNAKSTRFLIKNSRLPIVLATHFGQYHPDKEFFSAEKESVLPLEELVKLLPAKANFILNFDDETLRDLKNNCRARILTFGFGARADIQASDVFLTDFPGLGTNFKINYEGNIVPVWLKDLFGKENVYAALSAVAVGEVLGLNLVKISGSLKSYAGFPGRMKLIDGIKNTYVLDDSASASVLSMAEALGVLKKIKLSEDGSSERPGRKIAVLGDIAGIGKYSVESHEAMGEIVADCADMLFTVGSRAKFYAEGARRKGMDEKKIDSFNTAAEAGLGLQKTMKQGDLILIDGSAEIKMIKVVDEIKNI